MRSEDQVRDLELRERFAQLRREDEARAPKFAATLRPPQKKLTWGVVVGAAVLLVVAFVGVRRWIDSRTKLEQPAASVEASILHWTAPTDFLLRTPGAELLHTTPTLGRLPSISSGAPMPKVPRRPS